MARSSPFSVIDVGGAAFPLDSDGGSVSANLTVDEERLPLEAERAAQRIAVAPNAPPMTLPRLRPALALNG